MVEVIGGGGGGGAACGATLIPITTTFALSMVDIMITQIQVRRHGVIEYWGDVGGVILAACSAILNSITATPCF